MKVKLNQTDLESESLSWICIEPMLLAVRGKDFLAKSEMYNQLSEGQKGLYLFYSFHNHTQTLEEFYWFSAYHINELKSWNGIKRGLKYFNAVDLSKRLEDIEILMMEQGKEGKEISPTDLENDPKLKDRVRALHKKYKNNSKTTIQIMNGWIKANKTEFIEDKM
ncbi:hypothetical protein [Paenibacillus sp. Z6-24]